MTKPFKMLFLLGLMESTLFNTHHLEYSMVDSMDMNLSKLWETVEDRGAWCAAVHGIKKSQMWLSNWTISTTFCKWALSHHLPLSGNLNHKNSSEQHQLHFMYTVWDYVNQFSSSWFQRLFHQSCITQIKEHKIDPLARIWIWFYRKDKVIF